MDTKKRKEEIISALETTNDESLLEEVYELLNHRNAVDKISLDHFPAELQIEIDGALEDYKNGRYARQNETKSRTMAYQIVWSA